MQNNIMFDNIYVGHSVEEADALKKETWDVKIVGERAEEKAAEPKFDEKTEDIVIDWKKDPVGFGKQKINAFIVAAKKDPIEAAKTMPEVAGPIGLVILTVVALIMTALSPAAPSKEQVKAAAQKAKDAAEKTKDKTAAALATGADQTKETVSKRTTRSSEKP
jgi:calnexin